MGTTRTRVCSAALALVTAGTALFGTVGPVATVSAEAAEAARTTVGTVTHHSVCRTLTPSGQGWVFRSRVRSRAGVEDSRAGIALYRDGTRRKHWSSGWLDGGETAAQGRRVRRSPTVRIHVWQEAGDRDSAVGTALQRSVLRARDIRAC